MRRILLLICVILATMPLQAKDEGKGPLGLLKKVGTFLDSMAVSGVDRRYIGAPVKPWQVILRGNINQSDLKLNAQTQHADKLFEFMTNDITWEPRVKTAPATYLGFWAGYRGYGFGYSWNVGGDDGRILTFGATGGSYGVNLRIHWFETDNPEVNFSGTAATEMTADGSPIYEPFNYHDHIGIGSPIKTRSLLLDGYYLFNGKKCSYAAAYDQSVIQKRSAGSLMAGAMYFHSTTSYDNDINADLILFMNDIGKFKSWQVSAGVGYIYNWVIAKHLLISAMAIPMLTFYNHHKMWRYDSNLKDMILESGIDNIYDMDEKNYKIRPSLNQPEKSENSKMKVNLDARLSVTYEWNERFYINAFGQFCSFRYKIDDVSGRLNDWYINAAIGLRL